MFLSPYHIQFLLTFLNLTQYQSKFQYQWTYQSRTQLRFHNLVPVDVPKPYPVYHTKQVKVEVEKPVFVKQAVEVKVPVPKPYPVEVPTPVHIRVPHPVLIKEAQYINTGDAGLSNYRFDAANYGLNTASAGLASSNFGLNTANLGNRL
ncbi:unnamed protein product [Acanthoscelides obtectus]|uniref:Uncharacterized protein n=1 Tax=Acanthoscelides obtectus TaxID=200917 RepID=A0A9P0P047_ACAOB|nr:unnamed protein product [Acanthoscelides obtectus]CAK1631583.1 hypothetical protein AOBTE_LOCUS7019 [Acanthoscelides obtectus]